MTTKQQRAMSVQDLYDYVKKGGSDPANVMLMIGPTNHARYYPVAFNERFITHSVGSGGHRLIFKTDGFS